MCVWLSQRMLRCGPLLWFCLDLHHPGSACNELPEPGLRINMSFLAPYSNKKPCTSFSALHLSKSLLLHAELFSCVCVYFSYRVRIAQSPGVPGFGCSIFWYFVVSCFRCLAEYCRNVGVPSSTEAAFLRNRRHRHRDRYDHHR